MKIVVYTFQDSNLNLFKLRNGKIIHIPNESLHILSQKLIPDIICYIQEKDERGDFKIPTTSVAAITDVLDYNIEDAIKFIGMPKEYFSIKELR